MSPPPPVTNKCFESLSTKTKNALRRNRAKGWGMSALTGYHSDLVSTKPWELPIRALLMIRGIGPAAIKEIAEVAERFCV